MSGAIGGRHPGSGGARSGDGAGSGGRPYVVRGWRHTTLQFEGAVTQSRMLTWWPDLLQVGYTRTMLAGLLFDPRPACIGIIGLGGGSQAKFCHRHLPHSRIEAVESDAGVLALRREFRIPDDDARLGIERADGARWIGQRRDRYGLLLVDAYDVQGIPPALSTQAFYDACRAAMTDRGVMAVNLYDTDTRRHLARMRWAFDGRLLVLEEPRMSNKVAFAWNGERPGPDWRGVLARLPWRARWQLACGFSRLAAALQRR